MAKFCVRCGTKNSNSASVCSGCGISLGGLSMNTLTPVPENSIEIKKENEGKTESHSIGEFDFSKLTQTNLLLDEHIIDEISCQNDFIYILSPEVNFTSTEYKVVNNVGNKGLLKCKLIKYNGRDALYYMVGKLKSFEVMLSSLDATRFLYTMENVLNQVNTIKGNGFLADAGIDARIKRIYVDAQDGQVYMTYVPIKNRCYSDVIYLESDLRRDLAYIIRSSSLWQDEKMKIITQMLEEPGCSFNNLLSAVRQNRSISSITG